MPGFLRELMGSGLSSGQANAINGSGAVGQTATGSTQGTAFLLYASFTEFTTVAASTGARLPSATDALAPATGDSFFVANNGANALSVYPPTGGAIGTAAANTATAVAAGKTAYFIAKGNGNYFSVVSA